MAISNTVLLLASLGGALAAPLTALRRDNVLLQLTDSKATFYYDLTNQYCDATAGSALWATTSGINTGVPTCQGSVDKSLADIGTNRIVAMDASKVIGDMSEWCGKEVVITDASGKVFEFSEGPLYIWDACEACISDPHVDLSAKAFTELSGGTCGNNPSGLTIQVMDTNIVAAIAGSTSGGAVIGGDDSGSSAASSSTPTPSHTSSSRSAATASIAYKELAAVASASASVDASTASDDSAASASAQASGPASMAASSTEASTTPESTIASPPAASATDASAAAASSSPSATETASTSSGCTYGAWQCAGQDVQVCNYVSTTSLAWQSIGACPNSCKSDGATVWCE